MDEADDITSTSFEGLTAEGSACGYSRDKRMTRCQIVIGLVSDERGSPGQWRSGRAVLQTKAPFPFRGRISQSGSGSRKPSWWGARALISSWGWTGGDARYVGCASPERAHRDFTRRERAMETVAAELSRLQSGARKGSYSAQVCLYARVSDLLDQHGVKRYWEIRIGHDR